MPLYVVSGLPRSGTSLMMRMLVAAGLDAFVDGHRPADASNPRGYFEHEAVKASARDVSWVERAEGKAVKVISPLLQHLPRHREYRVVLMERPLSEVIDSQDRMLARLGEARPSLPRDRLSSVLDAKIAEARSLLAHESCFAVLRVDYRALIADPASGARDVAAFVDRPVSAVAMSEQVDPALHRSRVEVLERPEH